MVVNRDKAPSAQETFMQMAQAAGLRGRLLVTIGLLILVRLGIYLLHFNLRFKAVDWAALSVFWTCWQGGGFQR
jgi:hypothetical protein